MLFNSAVKLGESNKFSPHYKGPCVINKKLDETNYVLKPLKEGLREETVHQNRLKRSFLIVDTEQVPVEIKVENKKTLSKREEFFKYLQPAQMNTATETTTDSEYEFWEEQIGIKYSKPSNVINEEKSEVKKSVETNTPLKNETKKFRTKTKIVENTSTTSNTSQFDNYERRITSTPSNNGASTFSRTPNQVDFNIPSFHRWSTPIGKNLDKEFSRLLEFEEGEQTESQQEIEEQNVLHDDLDYQDADTEFLYEPTRAITPQPLQRNPERTRKKPERYGQVETNYITTTSSNENKLIKVKNKRELGLKFWLNLLVIQQNFNSHACF